MKVAVIVPTRDRPALLARALAGIAAQTHAELEAVVVDDGSAAPAREALRALAAAHPGRVRVLELGAAGGHGAGPGAARNAGLAAADGAELVAFCDDDDAWTDPGHLARVAAAFAADATLDLVVANQTGVMGEETRIADWLPALWQRLGATQRDDATLHRATVADLCAAGGFPHLNTVVFRRRAVDAAGGFWSAVRYEEDRDFFWRALDACRGIAAVRRPMAVHHIPDPSKQANASTLHARRDKLLISGMVGRHIALHVRQPAIARLARHAEGDVARQLAGIALQDGRRGTGLALAWSALGLRFSWKWLAFCAWRTLVPGGPR